MSKKPSWQKFSEHLLRYSDPDLWLDLSRMRLPEDILSEQKNAIEQSLNEISQIEAGEKVNTDEDTGQGGRCVGHYWLRNPELAPEGVGIRIERKIAEITAFAADIHKGEILTPNKKVFRNLLLIGIGGSALGPQLAIDALTFHDAPLSIDYFDNTDPDGIDRILDSLAGSLETTLTLVISKSGGTKETRNGMLEAQAAYEAAGLDFGRYAIAVTGKGSKLDRHAKGNEWIGVFFMEDWVGGRTSITSVVGLLPMALMGIDIDNFLQGAAAIDTKTRPPEITENASLLMALAWHHAGKGTGAKAMVILPYKDRLGLFPKYLQQLVMESLGKELNRENKVVRQGLTVYGNKGTTDQHAYVQQLRDGLNNFFTTFIEVRETRSRRSIEVDPGYTTGDYLEGFLRGTRSALFEADRDSMTISIPTLDAFHLGGIIALYERAVSYYAGLIKINAYHQPGVEAGKKAAIVFLTLLSKVENHLKTHANEQINSEELAQKIGADTEDCFHALHHLAANRKNIIVRTGVSPADDLFTQTFSEEQQGTG